MPKIDRNDIDSMHFVHKKNDKTSDTAEDLN